MVAVEKEYNPYAKMCSSFADSYNNYFTTLATSLLFQVLKLHVKALSNVIQIPQPNKV